VNTERTPHGTASNDLRAWRFGDFAVLGLLLALWGSEVRTMRFTIFMAALAVASLLGCYGTVAPKKASSGLALVSSSAGTLGGGRVGHAQVALLGSGAAIFGGSSATAAATDTIYVFSGGVVQLSSATLATARTEAAAILLPSGDVLVVGGIDANGSLLASSEIYSPGSDSVTRGPSLNVARGGANVFLEGDTVVVVGGADTGSGAGEVETWSSPSPRRSVSSSRGRSSCRRRGTASTSRGSARSSRRVPPGECERASPRGRDPRRSP
jgi:hypothetical protein